MNIEKSYAVAFAITGKTSEDLQQKMGVSYPTARKYARGACISVKSLEDAAALFGMSVSEFIKLGETE